MMKHKYATLLTAIGQGMPVEFQDAGGWHVADSDDLEEFNPLSNPDWNWRVKPVEPEYEWQWLIKRKNSRFALSYYYSNVNDVKYRYEYEGYTVYERIEASKREVELC